MRSTILSVLVVAALLAPAAPAAAQAPIFKFESDEFWLNLHKFLYVLGRAQNKDPNASRAAVAGAPGDAERGLASLTDAERKTWADAVTAYTRGLSSKDPIRDRDLALIEGRLADIDDARDVFGVCADGLCSVCATVADLLGISEPPADARPTAAPPAASAIPAATCIHRLEDPNRDMTGSRISPSALSLTESESQSVSGGAPRSRSRATISSNAFSDRGM